MNPRFSWAELIFPAILAALFVVIGTGPYVFGYWNATPDATFTGLVGKGVPNGQGYFMFMKQAQEGHNLFENKLTPEPRERGYFNLEWWVLGKLGRWTGLSLPGMFHVGRVMTVLLFFGALYFIAVECLATVFQRRLAVALVAFGAGLGWIPYTIAYALDFVYAQAVSPGLQWVGGVPFPNTALPLSVDLAGISIFGYLINKPHYIRAGAFALLKYGFIIRGERTRSRTCFVLSGVFGLLELAIRPFSLPETLAVYAAFALLMSMREGRIGRDRIINYILATALLVPGALYYTYLAWADVLGISGWERPSLHLGAYIAWFGIPLILAGLGFMGLAYHKRMRPSSVLLTLWIIVAVLISQAYPILKYGDEAAFFALAIVPSILIAGGVLRLIHRAFMHGTLAQWIGNHVTLSRARLAVAFVIACSLTSGIVYLRMFSMMRARPAPYYLPTSLLLAFAWVDANAQPQDVVLTSIEASPFVVRYTRSRAFTGNDLLTANWEHRNNDVNRFFQNAEDDEFKQHLVNTFGIDYVIRSPLDRVQNGFDPARYPWLVKVYDAGGAEIYEVRQAG